MTKADIVEITQKLQVAANPVVGSEYENKVLLQVQMRMGIIADGLIAELEEAQKEESYP